MGLCLQPHPAQELTQALLDKEAEANRPISSSLDEESHGQVASGVARVAILCLNQEAIRRQLLVGVQSCRQELNSSSTLRNPVPSIQPNPGRSQHHGVIGYPLGSVIHAVYPRIAGPVTAVLGEMSEIVAVEIWHAGVVEPPVLGKVTIQHGSKLNIQKVIPGGGVLWRLEPLLWDISDVEQAAYSLDHWAIDLLVLPFQQLVQGQLPIVDGPLHQRSDLICALHRPASHLLAEGPQLVAG